MTKIQKFSREGKILIDDAINCLFNAFDARRKGSLNIEDLKNGLKILAGGSAELPESKGKNMKKKVGDELKKKLFEQDKKKASSSKTPEKKAGKSVKVAGSGPAPSAEPAGKGSDETTMVSKGKRLTKEERAKQTAKSGKSDSIMEKQNKMRAEAAKKKKEDAARKRAEAAAANPEQAKEDRMQRVQSKLNAAKKLGLGGFDQAESKDAEINEIMSSKGWIDISKTVQDLGEQSFMRKVNAKIASQALKQYFFENEDSQGLNKQEFIDFMIKIMKNYDFCDSEEEEDKMRQGFDDVFTTFDTNSSGFLDQDQLANCLSLLCGGSIDDKLFAAFFMFDKNNSMTLSMDELQKFMKCVFQIFGRFKETAGATGFWDSVDVQQLITETCNRCFKDCKVKKSAEINYATFLHWMKGTKAPEGSNKPKKKSNFAQKTFANSKEFVEAFMDEEEFVDIVKELQEDSLLKNVRLFVIVNEFKKYKDSNQIPNDEFKELLKKVICDETHRHTGSECSGPDLEKIASISKLLVKIFDSNKNGKLEYQEAVSAFCMLCRGSVQSKIKYQMLAYSQVIDKSKYEDEEDIPLSELGIRKKNLLKFITCVLKIALQSSGEILLDYPIDKLAEETATKCFEFAQIEDTKDAIIDLKSITTFIQTASELTIYCPEEEEAAEDE